MPSSWHRRASRWPVRSRPTWSLVSWKAFRSDAKSAKGRARSLATLESSIAFRRTTMSRPVAHVRFCRSRDGARIAYETCGTGPPLIWIQHWIHHVQFDWDSPIWGHWLQFFSARHVLVRYDWRGCGLSDREGCDFGAAKLTEDLEAVVEAAGWDRFALFGMSGAGSAIAID